MNTMKTYQKTIKISEKTFSLANRLAAKHELPKSRLIHILLRMAERDNSFLRIYETPGESTPKIRASNNGKAKK
jgi:hypothetical protein